MSLSPIAPPAKSSVGYRFLLGEDHPLVRVGLKRLLRESFDCKLIGEAASGSAVLEEVGREKWDLLILDIGLPDRSGLDILPELKRLYPRLPVLILTVYNESQLGVRLLRGGAAGFLTKEAASEELATAVERVLAGGKYVSAQLAEQIAQSLDQTAQQPLHETLSNREFQVMRMLATGSTVAAIAAQLSLDSRTIGTFRRHILRKLKLNTTAEIVGYAIRNGLVP